MNYSEIVSPAYIFDSSVLRNRIKHIKSSIGENIALVYAVKANPFIVREADDLVDRFEVCSEGECNICLNLGISPDKLVISGVNKSEPFIDKLFSEGLCTGTFTVESVSQYRLLESLCRKYGTEIKVLLRLTSGNQFGITEEEITEIIKAHGDLISISGIQYFSGTQKTSLKKLKAEIEYLDSFICSLSSFGFSPSEIEYGGGFPVAYFEGEEFNEHEYFETFSSLVSGMNSKCHFKLELGRSIAASCGLYVTRVADVKSNKNGHFAIVDGGMNHIVYYGQMMAMKKPLLDVIPERLCEDGQSFTVCGSLCSVNDILLKQLPYSLEIGDILVFKNTGAYCMTEGIAAFLSRALPSVYIRDTSGKLHLVRDITETYPLNTPNYNP